MQIVCKFFQLKVMFKYEFSNGNACLVLDKRYKNKDSNFHLKWRVTVKRMQNYYPTGEN